MYQNANDNSNQSENSFSKDASTSNTHTNDTNEKQTTILQTIPREQMLQEIKEEEQQEQQEQQEEELKVINEDYSEEADSSSNAISSDEMFEYRKIYTKPKYEKPNNYANHDNQNLKLTNLKNEDENMLTISDEFLSRKENVHNVQISNENKKDDEGNAVGEDVLLASCEDRDMEKENQLLDARKKIYELRAEKRAAKAKRRQEKLERKEERLHEKLERKAAKLDAKYHSKHID